MLPLPRAAIVARTSRDGCCHGRSFGTQNQDALTPVAGTLLTVADRVAFSATG